MRAYLKDLREKARLSQKEVAEKLGISQNYYSAIETGERQKRLDVEFAVKFSEIFGVDVSWIIEQEKNLMNESA